MAKLARLMHELAELDARRAELLNAQARIFDELAEGVSVDLRTARRIAKPHVPKLSTEISAEAREAARKTLRDNEIRRRNRR